jgi:hypothetical protein
MCRKFDDEVPYDVLSKEAQGRSHLLFRVEHFEANMFRKL